MGVCNASTPEATWVVETEDSLEALLAGRVVNKKEIMLS